MPDSQKKPPYRVLIVEDNPVVRDLFMLAVERLHKTGAGERLLEVMEAEDGATAWDRINENVIDLVVLDLYLPILNGAQLIKRIRETPNLAHTKILAMSASVQDAHDLTFAELADRFIQKPLRLNDLLEALCSLLRLPLP